MHGPLSLRVFVVVTAAGVVTLKMSRNAPLSETYAKLPDTTTSERSRRKVRVPNHRGVLTLLMSKIASPLVPSATYALVPLTATPPA